tara:strand:- start:343 stop:513 length:171 start_codon:yes stop_codon:yes gene_type:complete
MIKFVMTADEAKEEILRLNQENENLRNHLDTVNEEIQILTGDLRATASALDDLEII